MPSAGHITQLLARAQEGDDQARDALLTATYDELRGLARAYLAQERPDHTLQATALVHEVYVRMLGERPPPGANRAQFLAYVAKAMRRILISHARSHGRAKRGGGRARVALAESALVGTDPTIDLVALDEALDRLAEIEPRLGRVVELRYFGGLTVKEVAQALDISTRTVNRDWEVAGTFLMRELGQGEPDGH